MNLRIRQLMKLHRLQDAAGEGGSDTGGTGSGDGQGAGGSGDGAGSGSGDNQGSAGAASGQGGAGDGGQGSKPSDSEAKLLKEVMKHKKRAEQTEAELAQVKEKLASFDGLDLSKVREMLAEQEEAERKRAEAKGDYDRLVKQMGERHTTEKTALQKQIEEANRASQTLQQQIAELTVGNAFTGSKFVQDELTLTPTKARVIYGAHFEFKDGKVVGFDKPAGASDRTVLVDATGEPLGFEDAMRKIIDTDPDRDQLIRSKMKAGAGSSTNPKGAKKAEADANRQLTSVERIAAGLKALAKQN